LPPPLFYPSWIMFTWRIPKIEMRPYNTCLPLCINGDAHAFGTKGRCTLTTRDTYYPSNQRHAPSNTCLHLVTKVGASPILCKLRCATKTHITFLASPAPGPPSRMWACLALLDRRRLPVGTSLIRVSYLSFLCSGGHSHYDPIHLFYRIKRVLNYTC
jgi:hypothetical protein